MKKFLMGVLYVLTPTVYYGPAEEAAGAARMACAKALTAFWAAVALGLLCLLSAMTLAGCATIPDEENTAENTAFASALQGRWVVLHVGPTYKFNNSYRADMIVENVTTKARIDTTHQDGLVVGDNVSVNLDDTSWACDPLMVLMPNGSTITNNRNRTGLRFSR